MGFLDFLRRSQEDPEAARRARLLRTGRITEGTVIDIQTDEAGIITHVFFNYQIGGVEYESSQSLDAHQQLKPASYAPGSRITIRFDPHQPANSIVV